MEYIKVSEATAKWEVSTRRVRILCAEGCIGGVIRNGNLYMISSNALRPSNGRSHRTSQTGNNAIFNAINQLKTELSECRQLSTAETEALRQEFIVEHTYNSNAIEGNTLTLQETQLVLQCITIDRKPLKDHLEVVGYKEAFECVEQLARNGHSLTNHDICTIHSLEVAAA